ncbi:NAD(P)/FAD-dependent oxidoreductase [Paracrocinitomix mangrovi]|uniref:NAD(P)/FAD-dependent oxidoreductase n=1 Tax=Paracrocinitomix mangrovi TaxID=2862509 RepID=UPI001C8DE2B8|nr:NAD(P)/FAD-dependent oxidoreductase [Paracrocinitomix mangrovi]UKN00695.1 NAD(P)/FAD-dependent oxidoreductase [Paracrocinitomix mangrovi]
MNIPDIDLPRVVVIGAGFAGLKLARQIDTRFYQLVLIDKNNYHTFQPLLYQVATAGLEPDSIAYPVRKTLRKKKNMYFRLTEVNQVKTQEKIVSTSMGELKYDYLIVATGATNNYFGIDSVEENAMPMKTLTEALNLRSKMLQNFENALNINDLDKRLELMNVVIVGAGPTGVELAGAIAELRNRILPKDFPDLDFRQMEIHLIEAAPRVLAAMSKQSSERAYNYLKKLGVNIYTDMIVESYDNNLVKTKSGKEFKTDTLIWAAGVAADHPDGFGDDLRARGNRLKVNEYLQLTNNEDVYVLGDAAYLETKDFQNGLPMLGAVAMQAGAYLAKQFNRKARKKKIHPFKYKDKGSMATVGRNLAVVDLKNSKLGGTFAWLTWMFVHLMLLVGFRNRVIVFINWVWNYIRFNNGLRLIVRPYKKKEDASN